MDNAEDSKTTSKRRRLEHAGYYIKDLNDGTYGRGRYARNQTYEHSNDLQHQVYRTNVPFDYDGVNDMLTDLKIPPKHYGRSVEQIAIANMLSNGVDISALAKSTNRDDSKNLATRLANALDYWYKIWEKDEILFINKDQNRYIECDDKIIAECIYNLCGLQERHIIHILPDVNKLIRQFCKRGNRVFTDITIREHWHFVNFPNCLYDIITKTSNPPVIAAKTGYINSYYIDKANRGENNGAMWKFATLCSNNELYQKRLLQVLAYAISDYRDKNRLFVFESDNDRPLQIIEALMKKVLSDIQVKPIPLHGLIDNINFNHIKLIISRACKSNYEADDDYNDRLYRILSGANISYSYEEKRKVIYEDARSDLVVFHLKALPIKFIDTLSVENRKRITVIKLQCDESTDWDDIEYQMLSNVDCGVSYLIDEVLFELYENDFNFAGNEDSKQEEIITPENTITQVKAFIREMCVTGEGYSISKIVLHSAFKEYSGVDNRNTFYDIIKTQFNIKEEKKDNKRVFLGIDLK